MNFPSIANCFEYSKLSQSGFQFAYSNNPDNPFGEEWERNRISFFSFTAGEKNSLPVFVYYKICEDGPKFYYSFPHNNNLDKDWFMLTKPVFTAFETPNKDTRPLYEFVAFKGTDQEKFAYSLNDGSEGEHSFGEGWILNRVAFYVFAANAVC